MYCNHLLVLTTKYTNLHIH